MAIGTVKWFNNVKGYGFIQPEDGGKDVFVHVSAVERAGMRSLVEGQRLSFEVQTERGRSAAVTCRSRHRGSGRCMIRLRLRVEGAIIAVKEVIARWD